MSAALRLLFVTSEAAPWIKTGGLADAAAGLARALAAQGHDVRVLLPAYGDTLAAHPDLPPANAAGLIDAGTDAGGVGTWLARLRGVSDRRGNPYVDGDGRDWPDNWQRFGDFARVAAAVAANRAGLDWRPDLVHCHDWQAGLVPVLMMLRRTPAASVFTVHNLAHQGLFAPHALQALSLPAWLWHHEALEFHGQLSFIKGGLSFADRVTTVSPTYAAEILRPEHGRGLDGVLRSLGPRFSGIVNGIDTRDWDPATDPHLPAHYDAGDLTPKRRCKSALQQELDLERDSRAPLLGVVSRLAAQKGIDLLLPLLPELLRRGCQLAVLGSGDSELERALAAAASAHPGRIGLRLGFDEGLAHRIEAGADLFLMPSRFEPCGLNQMYSQRYGTPPIVARVGGLADTVIDASEDHLADGSATGFAFDALEPASLLAAIDRALALRDRTRAWRQLRRAGMTRDFSWGASAAHYLDLYRSALADRDIAHD